MAGNRIRSVRPELAENPRFAGMTDGAVRLWLGLLPSWDDEGRSYGSVGYVAGRVYFRRTKTKAMIGRELAELESAGWLIRYEVAGVEYLAVRGWSDPDSDTYQYIKAPRPSKLPAPPSIPGANDGANDGAKPYPLEGDQDQEQEVEQEGDGGKAGRSRGNGHPTPHPIPDGWVPEDSEANRAATAKARARGVDIDQQLANLRDWALERDKRFHNWNARWRRWLSDAHPADRSTPPPPKHDDERTRIRNIPKLGRSDGIRPRPSADDPLADPLEREDRGDPITTDDGVS